MFTPPSPRRAAAVMSGSYASVLAGQSRLSRQNEPRLSGTAPLFVPNSGLHGLAQHAHSTEAVPAAPAVVPSYLADSAYAERLARATRIPPQSSLPTPPSSFPAAKGPTSYRGTSFEVVEQNFHVVDETPISPLPSRFIENEKSATVELLAGGLEARFSVSRNADPSTEASVALRSDFPMPPQCGIFYFEITVLSKGKEGLIGVGFCAEKMTYNKLPGWEANSWGYHGDDGTSFCSGGSGKKYGPSFSAGDIVGCGVNFRTRTAFFTKNGLDLGVAFKDLDPKLKLYPAIGMKRSSEHIRVNFGKDQFAYDIESHMRREKEEVYSSLVRSSPLTSISQNHSEDELIRLLVSSYLAHNGYVETLKAFASDAQNLDNSLNHGKTNAPDAGRMSSGLETDFGESRDVSNRQKIRSAILAGDFDRAMDFTRRYYPSVLENNENIYFKLRCRKLIEMIAGTSASSATAPTNGRSSHDEPMQDVFESDMEMDDNLQLGSEWERMDIAEDSTRALPKESLAEAVEYAQQLRVEFRADTRPEIRQALEESFSLVAYADPKNSVMAHLFDEDGRMAVAEELNSAILVSQGKQAVPVLERLLQQATILISEASVEGGASAFINVQRDFLNDDVWDC